jgi:tetratricopeptide (TPR) repeat protein
METVGERSSAERHPEADSAAEGPVTVEERGAEVEKDDVDALSSDEDEVEGSERGVHVRMADPAAALRLKEEGNTLFREGKPEEALERYREAVALSPTREGEGDVAGFAAHRAAFHSNAAACLLSLGRFEECIEECDLALDLDETYTKAALRRAQALEGLEKWADAIEDYEDLLSHDPGNRAVRARLEAAREKEKAHAEKMKEDVMGKLKDVGNSFLGMFGLSTENFEFVQSGENGGYSINFKQGDQASAGGAASAGGDKSE